MNNAERRLHEIEERLEGFEAPEAPQSLIESIEVEIPADLGASAGQGGGPVVGFPWRRMAASLAVVALGGLLGYKLLQEGPSLEDAVTPVGPSGALHGPPADVVELGEAPPASAVAAGEEVMGGREPQTRLPGKDDSNSASSQDAIESAPDARRRDLNEGKIVAPVAGGGKEEPAATELRRELGESPRDPSAALNQTPDVLVDRINVGGNESGQQSEFLAATGDVDQANIEFEATPSEAGALEKRVETAPTAVASPAVPPPPAPMAVRPERRPRVEIAYDSALAEEILVTSESPLPELGSAMDRPSTRDQRREIPKPGPVAPSTGGTTEPNDQAYGDMFFQAYGTNPFVDTEDDAQSTFGIDVDTASYTMARSYLERGSLPPADAIRVEEFVNYFDYNDPAPRNRDFAVVAEGAPSPFASTARTHLLRFALKGREIAEGQRKAAVLTFVVDVSGSMNRENRLGLVKRALRLLVGELDSGDAIGLVVYGSSGRVILEPTSNHDRVLSAIESLQPGGSTNAEEGLVFGYRTARRFFRDGAINRVILCSDGVANVGNTGPESILDRIASEAEQGIELTTVGFGMGNYNDVLMEQLADKGDGNYAYVDDLDAARRVFVENLSGTLETIAGDAKIQVEFDKQVVQSYRLLGYENRDIADRDFRNDAVDAGEIGAGHQVTALYEVKLRPDAARRGNVATLRLRYKSRRSGRVVEDAVTLTRSDLAGSWNRASYGLQVAATAAEFAEVLRGSYWARDSNLTALAERARGLARSGSWAGDLAELSELIVRAARLRGAPAGQWEDGIER